MESDLMSAAVAPALSAGRTRVGMRVARIAVGAGLVALASQIAFPLPGTPVPFTLQAFAVIVVGGLLGPAEGAAAMVLYLALGAAGLPVFSPLGLGNGIARLFGPAGGYLLAFPAAAAVTGALARRTVMSAWVACFCGMALIHLGGVSQMAILTGDLNNAIQIGSLPFFTVDMAKVGFGSLFVRVLRPRLYAAP